MSRIFVTGDKHGNFYRVYEFCQIEKTTTDDILIIAGDAGLNYYLSETEDRYKKIISDLPITLLIVHGNHEERAWNVKGYSLNNHIVGKNRIIGYSQKEYPNIIFTEDYYEEILNGKKFLFLGGAYSVDKHYRITKGYKWFESEQMSEAEMVITYNIIKTAPPCYDYVISHTAPLKFEPTELFMFGIDQSTVDKRTEKFLDAVDDVIDYKQWIFGHYHGDIDKGNHRVIYHDFIELG